MSNTYDVGRHFEGFIQTQVKSGRYEDESDVVRDALKLMEEREKRASAIDASVSAGLDDIAAGRMYDSDDVFRELAADLKTHSRADRT